MYHLYNKFISHMNILKDYTITYESSDYKYLQAINGTQSRSPIQRK